MSTYNQHRNAGALPSSSSTSRPLQLPQIGKLAELLEGVKRECEGISIDAGLWKEQRDEMESKIQQQIQETAVMRQALYDLESQHSKIRQEYEAEILHLRRELDSRGPAQSAQKPASSYAPSAPVLPNPGGRTSPLPGIAGGRGGTPGAAGGPSQQNQQQQQQQQGQGQVGFLGAPPGSKAKGSDYPASALPPVNRQHSSTPSNIPAVSSILPTPSSSTTVAPISSTTAPHIAAGGGSPSSSTLAPQFSANPPPPPRHNPHQQPPSTQIVQPGQAPVIVSDIDPDSSVKELKKEGSDWLAIWSPTAKRAIDVGLVHTLVHESVVCCVKFSQDGKWLATGCNRTVQIFDTKTGAKSCVLQDDTSPISTDLYIRTICFSPDGKFLATGAEDRQIRIWDISKRRIRHLLQGHAQEIYSLDFSADGRHVVSGSGDKSARIWDIETGACVFDLKVEDLVEGDAGPVDAGLTSVAFSPDGRLFAAGSLDAIVRLWDTKTGIQLGRFAGHSDSVYSVSFSPDGKTLCSGSLDRSIRVWDLSGPRPPVAPGARRADPLPNGEPGSPFGACERVLAGHKDYVLSVGISNDGRWIVSGSKDRTVQFYDAKTGQVQLMLQGHKNSVISIDLSKTTGLLASGSGDLNARIWNYSNV